jgi:hypothetical protein
MLYCLGPGGGNNTFQRGASSGNLAAATTSELEKLDWRLAIGEVSMNLRREVADKASREELYSAVRTEVQTLDERLAVSRKSARENIVKETIKIVVILWLLVNNLCAQCSYASFVLFCFFLFWRWYSIICTSCTVHAKSHRRSCFGDAGDCGRQ